MRKRIISVLMILLLIPQHSLVFAGGTPPVFSPPATNAPAACVIDAKTGAVIYGKGMDDIYYPASITKIMTALLTIEYVEKGGGNYQETVTFPREAIYGLDPEASKLGLAEGETLTIIETLYAVMLKSANEACIGLGIHISGSHEAFAKRMTERAKELGCKNTNFTNANGLHDANHYTTAYDMALIMREAVKNEMFVRLISTDSHVIPPTNKFGEPRTVINSNQLIQLTSQYYYSKAVGSKTGYTDEAQHTLVTFVKDRGAELICAILHGDKSMPYTDTSALCDAAAASYQDTVLLSVEQVLKDVSVYQTVNNELKAVGSTGAKAKEDISALVPPSVVNAKTVVYQTEVNEKIIAPVKEGDVIGTVRVLSGDVEIGRTELIASNDVTWLAQKTGEPEKREDESIPVSVSSDKPLDTDKETVRIIFWDIDRQILRNVMTVCMIILIPVLLVFLIRAIMVRRRRRMMYLNRRRRRPRYR